MQTIIDGFYKHLGTKEYEGIVAIIQRWFYGTVLKLPWCATSTSYFADQAGILDQIGGKNEGVYEMYQATKKHCEETGVGEFWEYPHLPATLKRNDILFLLRNGRSHVCHVISDIKFSASGSVSTVGGNQSDMICIKPQAMNGIQGVYRPDYGGSAPQKKQTVKYGAKGDTVKELQRDLNTLGYFGLDGKKLDIDGSCGGKTVYAIETFQMDYQLDVDGSCGPKTWAKIEEALQYDFYTAKVTTDLNVRKGPAKTYDRVRVLSESETVTVGAERNGWCRIVGSGGWVSGSYLDRIKDKA